MGLIILWVIMALIVAIIAGSKGRSGFAWFLYGFLIWPIALVHALVASSTPKAGEKRAAAEGRKKCPFCAEMIKAEAKVCPHCQRDLPEGWVSGDH